MLWVKYGLKLGEGLEVLFLFVVDDVINLYNRLFLEVCQSIENAWDGLLKQFILRLTWCTFGEDIIDRP